MDSPSTKTLAEREGWSKMLASKRKPTMVTTTPQTEDRMMQFFAYAHLPPHLQVISAQFRELAVDICNSLPSNPERTVALRKLLEAKDCAVRAYLYKEPGTATEVKDKSNENTLEDMPTARRIPDPPGHKSS